MKIVNEFDSKLLQMRILIDTNTWKTIELIYIVFFEHRRLILWYYYRVCSVTLNLIQNNLEEKQ